MPKLYKINGDVVELTPNNGKFFTLEELYRHCDCELIQIVPMPSGLQLVCDDEGKLKSPLQVNQKATEIWKKEYPIEKYTENNDELVVGNVIICEEKYLEGEE